MRRKNSKTAILLIWLSFVVIFVVWLGRFAFLRQVAILNMAILHVASLLHLGGIPDVSAKDVSAKTWRRTFRFKKMPKRIRLKTFAETFRMICGAYPVYARSPSLSQRPAPTTIASRSPFPLGLCSCSTSLSKMGI